MKEYNTFGFDDECDIIRNKWWGQNDTKSLIVYNFKLTFMKEQQLVIYFLKSDFIFNDAYVNHTKVVVTASMISPVQCYSSSTKIVLVRFFS